MIEAARAELRSHLNSGQSHHIRIQFLVGQIICARIVEGELTPKLKDPAKIRIAHG